MEEQSTQKPQAQDCHPNLGSTVGGVVEHVPQGKTSAIHHGESDWDRRKKLRGELKSCFTIF